MVIAETPLLAVRSGRCAALRSGGQVAPARRRRPAGADWLKAPWMGGRTASPDLDRISSTWSESTPLPAACMHERVAGRCSAGGQGLAGQLAILVRKIQARMQAIQAASCGQGNSKPMSKLGAAPTAALHLLLPQQSAPAAAASRLELPAMAPCAGADGSSQLAYQCAVQPSAQQHSLLSNRRQNGGSAACLAASIQITVLQLQGCRKCTCALNLRCCRWAWHGSNQLYQEGAEVLGMAGAPCGRRPFKGGVQGSRGAMYGRLGCTDKKRAAASPRGNAYRQRRGEITSPPRRKGGRVWKRKIATSQGIKGSV